MDSKTIMSSWYIAPVNKKIRTANYYWAWVVWVDGTPGTEIFNLLKSGVDRTGVVLAVDRLKIIVKRGELTNWKFQSETDFKSI